MKRSEFDISTMTHKVIELTHQEEQSVLADWTRCEAKHKSRLMDREREEAIKAAEKKVIRGLARNDQKLIDEGRAELIKIET